MVDATIFLIITSVFSCAISGAIAVLIILKRDLRLETVFFSLFLLGSAIYVFLYLFLFDETLKYLHYPLQTIFISLATFGFFMFAFSMDNEGENIKKMAIPLAIILSILPVLNFILTPYTFIFVPYGTELNVEPWFLTSVALVTIIFLSYAMFIILKLSFKSPSLEVRKKIKIILFCLVLMVVFGTTFLAIIPVITQIHQIKPIGYFIISASMILMTYAFRKSE